MPTILDSAPYSWHDPVARELHRALYRAIPRSSRTLFVAEAVALDTGLMNADQPPFDLWKDVLDLAASSQKTRALVEYLRSDSTVATIHPLLDALLKAQPPVIDREPQRPDGAPAFIANDDTVTEPEALLFHDDLTLSIGRVPWLIEVLRQLIKLAPGICRLEVSLHNQSQSGTGLRIGADLLLTNWHVLFLDGSAATAVTAEFGYETDINGNALPAVPIICKTQTIRGDKADDWAIVRVQQPLPDNIPIIDIFTGATPTQDVPAFVIQHPGGGRKRIAYVRNQITYFDDRVVHYLSDTQVGSSGSPVFDQLGQAIALHHAGGRPQAVAGQLPTKKNEGIRMSRVAAGLHAAGVV
jgi:hypothetical protein